MQPNFEQAREMVEVPIVGEDRAITAVRGGADQDMPSNLASDDDQGHRTKKDTVNEALQLRGAA